MPWHVAKRSSTFPTGTETSVFFSCSRLRTWPSRKGTFADCHHWRLGVGADALRTQTPACCHPEGASSPCVATRNTSTRRSVSNLGPFQWWYKASPQVGELSSSKSERRGRARCPMKGSSLGHVPPNEARSRALCATSLHLPTDTFVKLDQHLPHMDRRKARRRQPTWIVQGRQR